MHLLQIALAADLAAAYSGRAPAHRDRSPARSPKAVRGELDQLLVIHLAGRGQHQAARRVMAAHVAADGLARQAADDLGLAQHRPAHGLIGKGGRLEMIEDDVVGRVLGLADLLQHHGALARQLLGIEGRVLQDVGDDVDGERQIVRQDLGVIGRLLARGIGVEMAAHRLDLLGDGARAERRSVPLKAICSSRWETPLISAGSLRVPTSAQTPSETVSTESIRSLATRKSVG